MSILAKLEYRYGVKGGPAVRDQQRLYRSARKLVKVQAARHAAFFASPPRLVKKSGVDTNTT